MEEKTVKSTIKKMALNLGVIAVTTTCISNIGVGNGLITFAEEIGETGYYTIDGTSISKEEADERMENGEIISNTTCGDISKSDYELLVEEYENFDSKVVTESEAAEVLISKKENEIEAAEQRIRSLEERLKEKTWIRDLYSKAKEKLQAKKEELKKLFSWENSLSEQSGVSTLSATLPARVDLSNSIYFPAIRSQGNKGSCVCFSTTYYQYSYMANSLNDVSSKVLANCYSPEWTYSQFKYGNDGTERMCDYLRQSGCVKWNECLYDGTVGNDVAFESVSEKALMNALYTKIDKWGILSNSFSTNPIVEGKLNTSLELMKKYLDNGILLHANISSGLDIMKTNNTKEQIVVRDYKNSKTAGHALTIVGYDDTIWCDVNKNNKKDPGETGAFKVANSYGDTYANNGYIWFLYDSLNKVSQISGQWDANCQGERLGAFGTGVFYFTMRATKPSIVAKVEYTNVRHADLKAILRTSATTNSIEQAIIRPVESQTTTKSIVRLYDYDTLVDDSNEILGNNSYKLQLAMQNSTKGFGTAKFSLIDSNFNVIASRNGTITSNGTYGILKKLSIGDLDYDGTITSNDADLAVQHVLKIDKLSNLQVRLADYDGDGTVTLTDAQKILKQATSK